MVNDNNTIEEKNCTIGVGSLPALKPSWIFEFSIFLLRISFFLQSTQENSFDNSSKKRQAGERTRVIVDTV